MADFNPVKTAVDAFGQSVASEVQSLKTAEATALAAAAAATEARIKSETQQALAASVATLISGESAVAKASASTVTWWVLGIVGGAVLLIGGSIAVALHAHGVL
jgi:hypothetical protein